MEINFSKYNGAGNDFILIDDRDNFINVNKFLISYLCDRHFGVPMEIWDHYVEMVPDVLYYLHIIKI